MDRTMAAGMFKVDAAHIGADAGVQKAQIGVAGKSKLYGGYGPDENGNQVQGSYEHIPDPGGGPGTTRFIPGVQIMPHGGAGGATQALIGQLQAEAKAAGKDMTTEEALRIIHDPASASKVAALQERLASEAARSDIRSIGKPKETLDFWRNEYGLAPHGAAATPGESKPSTPAKPAPAAAAKPGEGAQTWTKEHPLVPKTQADIDGAPSGSVIQTPDGLRVKP
jgi:hypothetical protein